MIGWLRGKIIEVYAQQVLLDVNGVGYEVFVAQDFSLQHHEIIALYIYTLVREDTLTLFGFSTKEDCEFFKNLIKLNGIGPKTALGILAKISMQDLIQFIAEKDIQSLAKLPGIGKKTAERLIIDMQDKFSMLANQSESNKAIKESIMALESLGYKPNEALRAIKQVDASGNVESEELIRQALQILALQ